MSAVVTMCFNNSEYVPFRVFDNGTARYVINDSIVRQINDFGTWFLSAVDRGWKMVAQYNLPDNVLLDKTSLNVKHSSRSEEFHNEWYAYEEEYADNFESD